MSFNRVTVTNESAFEQVLELELLLPNGWTSTFGPPRIIRVQPDATIELPLRTAPARGSTSGPDYPITVKVSSVGRAEYALRSYVGQVQPVSQWQASLVNSEVQLDRINDETYFRLRFTNRGNVSEPVTIDFITDFELTVPRKNFTLLLAPSTDSIVTIGILTDHRILQAMKPQDLRIEIKGKDQISRPLNLRVYSNHLVFRENPSRWLNLPSYVEVVAQDFSLGRRQYYLNSAGTIDLEKGRSVTYNFRSDNYYADPNGFSNRNAHINFASEKWKVSLGDQTEYGEFLIDGLGARISHSAVRGYDFDILGVKSRFGNARQLRVTQSYAIRKALMVENRSFFGNDLDADVGSAANVTELNAVMGNSTLILSGGYGTETIGKTRERRTGPSGGLNYYFQSPTWSIRSVNRATGMNFPGLERGVLRTSNEARAIIRKNFFAGALAEYNDRSVSVVDSSRFITLFGGKISEYGLRSGYSRSGNSITLTASHVDQLRDSSTNVAFRSKKLNLNVSGNLWDRVNLYLSANIIQTKSRETARAIHAFNGYGWLQTGGSGITFRIEKGPFYYPELLAFTRLGIETDRFQVAPYLERTFFQSALTSRAELNYLGDVGYDVRSLSFRIDLNTTLRKSGVSLRLYADRDLSNNKPAYFSLSIRKNFTIPLLGLKKYNRLSVVLFKDKNNNNTFDEQDEAIRGASLKVGGQYFITDSLGVATYKNISRGSYLVELGTNDMVKGWVARNGYKQSVLVEKNQNCYIPFKESGFISGKLNVVTDILSKSVFDPANIRITAVSSRGETFSTLTNEQGTFFMNLPRDRYLVQINPDVFRENYRVLEGAFDIDLSSQNRDDLIFQVREKRRQMNIRRE